MAKDKKKGMKKFSFDDKKKLKKEALKSLLRNPKVISRFRCILGMFDYPKKDVKKEIKKMVKRYTNKMVDLNNPDDFIDERMKERKRERKGISVRIG